MAALAPPAVAAQDAVLRHARLGAAAAVAVLPRPAAFTVTLPAVAHSVAYRGGGGEGSVIKKDTKRME